MPRSTLILAAATFLAATPAMAQVMSPSEYLAVGGASDLYEETASKLVLETTHDQAVHAFADEMVADHMKLTHAAKRAAEQSHVAAPPPKLDPAQEEMIAQLRAETGPRRDAAYLAQQRAAHGQALDVQKAYAADGSDASLKAAAASAVPVVERHIKALMSM